MKIGLYSITYLGVWYRGRALTLEELFARARQFGYEGVEIDGKRPHGNPLDLPKSRCQDLRSRAADAGVEIYAVAANNDFSSPIPEHRESQLLYMRELIRMTSDLGVRTLRVFAGWPGVTMADEGGSYANARRVWREEHLDVSDTSTWARSVEGLQEAARWAGDMGVTLALQNHAPVTMDPDDTFRMIRDVNSPHVKACIDAPMAARQQVPSMRKAALDAAGIQVLSHVGGEYERTADGSVQGLVRNPDMTLTPETYYREFLEGMRDIGYDGYLGYELCHPLPTVNGEAPGIEFADNQAQLAAEYFRAMLKDIASPAEVRR